VRGFGTSRENRMFCKELGPLTLDPSPLSTGARENGTKSGGLVVMRTPGAKEVGVRLRREALEDLFDEYSAPVFRSPRASCHRQERGLLTRRMLGRDNQCVKSHAPGANSTKRPPCKEWGGKETRPRYKTIRNWGHRVVTDAKVFLERFGILVHRPETDWARRMGFSARECGAAFLPPFARGG
jgi:hypothetical protein